jgi:hypothetical protein
MTQRNSFPHLQKTVFIVTYGRSGSTLVQNMLNAVPGACIRGENENLLAPFARAWDMLRSSEQVAKFRDANRTTGSSDPWFGFEAVTPEHFGAHMARAFTEPVLRPAPDTRITGFKEIRWANDPLLFPVMLDFIRAFFPLPHIVFNLRDHAAVCRSGWWNTMDPNRVTRILTEAEDLYASYAARHPGATLTLRYDDYIRGPDMWRPLFTYLGEPFDPARVKQVLSRKLTHLKPKQN